MSGKVIWCLNPSGGARFHLPSRTTLSSLHQTYERKQITEIYGCTIFNYWLTHHLICVHLVSTITYEAGPINCPDTPYESKEISSKLRKWTFRNPTVSKHNGNIFIYIWNVYFSRDRWYIGASAPLCWSQCWSNLILGLQKAVSCAPEDTVAHSCNTGAVLSPTGISLTSQLASRILLTEKHFTTNAQLTC